jgi:Na+/H+ antiporter NhaD/arsenite permease-like protein
VASVILWPIFGVGGLVIVVFAVTYTAITSEKVNRTAMSLTGMGIVALILWAAGVSKFQDLTALIGWYTVLFVTGQMIIVGVSRASGMYQYLALKIALPSGGNPPRLFTILLVFDFLISMFFDTTSTMLIIGPITIELCEALDLDIKSFLVSEAIVANFASIPSIVGDVPNLVVANATFINPGFQFIAFFPLSFILLLVCLPLLRRFYRQSLAASNKNTAVEMLKIDPSTLIRSRLEFYMSIAAMIALILAFTIGVAAGLEASLASITIAAIMLLFTRGDVDRILKEVNWGTVVFVIGIFGIVAALEATGMLSAMASWAGVVLGGGGRILATLFMIWVPGLLSSVIDNVPIAALLAPLAVKAALSGPMIPLALVFGVNVGAFLLPIGSPANIIALALSEAEHDPIGMKGFAKAATPIALIMMAIGTVWILALALLIP